MSDELDLEGSGKRAGGARSEPSSSVEPGLWKVADVARFFSMSMSWVYKEVEAGRLPCIRLGAAVRFSPDAMRRHLAGLQVGNVLPLRPK